MDNGDRHAFMDVYVMTSCRASYDEKSSLPINSPNGHRERTRSTRAGSVALKIPDMRQGCYFPEFLAPRITAGMDLTAVIQDAYGFHRQRT